MAALASYLLGLLPKLSKFMPTKLMDGTKLLQKVTEPSDCYVSIGVACATMVLCVVCAVVSFDRKKL